MIIYQSVSTVLSGGLPAPYTSYSPVNGKVPYTTGGVFADSMISQAANVLTVQGAATTTLDVTAGSAQSTTDLFRVKDFSGAALVTVLPSYGANNPAIRIANAGTGGASLLTITSTQGFSTGAVSGGYAIQDINAGASVLSFRQTGTKWQIGSGGIYGWSSTTDSGGTSDTSLSKISAGIIGVGTGAQGSYAGTLQATRILGGSAVGDALTLQSTSGVGTTDHIRFLVGNGGSPTEAMRIINSGFVGIGGTPSYPLNVKSTAVSDIAQFRNDTVSGSTQVYVDSYANQVRVKIAAAYGSLGVIGTETNYPFNLIANNISQMGVNGTLVAFGPSVAFTSSFPALKRSGAAIAFRLADDSADATITALSGSFSGSVTAGATQDLKWSTRASMQSSADGVINLLNAAQDGFTRVTYGPATSSFPSLKRSTTGLIARLADDSADTWLQMNHTRHNAVTVANLPASPVEGMLAFVSDSNAATFLAGLGLVVAGGGSTHCPVFYDGTNWRIG